MIEIVVDVTEFNGSMRVKGGKQSLLRTRRDYGTYDTQIFGLCCPQMKSVPIRDGLRRASRRTMNPNKILETMPSTEKMMEWYDSLPKVQGKCHAKYQWFQDTILIDHCIKIRGKGAVEQTFHEHLYGLARGCLLCKKGAMVTPAGQRLYQMSGFFEQKGRWPTKRDKCELVYEPDWLYKVVLSRFPTSGMEEFEAFETHCYLRVL